MAPSPSAAPPTARKSAPGQPWSHLETIHLIDAYEERWYALKRGQLKAHQWDAVAASVAARCAGTLPPGAPPKSGTQCRHKMEKLRKRYRAERQRASGGAHPSPWPYFARIDRMERGPLPISVRPPPPPPISAVDEDSNGSDESDGDSGGNNTRSINGILQAGGWGPSRSFRSPPSRKRRDFYEENDEEEEEEEEEEDNYDNYDDDEEEEEERRGSSAMAELAGVVRRFGEGLVRMEKRRMEVMREVERDWMEMEARRTEMVMDAQRGIAEMIAGAFAAKRVKRQESSPQDL